MKNENGRLNSHWILLYNQSKAHMVSNHTFIVNIKATYKPINVYFSGGATNCETVRNLQNIEYVYLQ